MDVACLVPRPARRAEAVRAALDPLCALSDRVRLTFYGGRGGTRVAGSPARPLEALADEWASFDALVYVLDGAPADVRQVATWAARRSGILVLPSADSPWLGQGRCSSDDAPLLAQLAADGEAIEGLAAAIARRSCATVVGEPRVQELLSGCPRVCCLPSAGGKGDDPENDESSRVELRQRLGLAPSNYLFASFGSFTAPTTLAAALAIVAELGSQGYPVQYVLEGCLEGAAAELAASCPQAVITGQLREADYRGLWQLSDVVFSTFAAHDVAEPPYRVRCGVHPDQAAVELAAGSTAGMPQSAQAALLTELEHLMQSPATRRRTVTPTASAAQSPPTYAAQLWWNMLQQAVIHTARPADALLPSAA